MFDALRRWDNYLQASGLTSDTRRNYRYHFVRFVADTMLDPAEVTEDDVTEYLAGIDQRGQTVQQMLRALKSYYAWAVRRKIHAANPADAIKFKNRRRMPAKSFTREELMQLFLAAANRDQRRAWAIILLVETGARIGSMEAVRPGDVGTEAGQLIHFRKVKHDRPYALPLSPLAAEAVRELLPGSNGTLLGVSRRTLWRWFHDAAVDAGFPEGKRNAHLARDTAATLLYQQTKNARLVQDFLNHADLSQLHRYVATTNEELRAALARSLAG
jgi:integrase